MVPSALQSLPGELKFRTGSGFIAAMKNIIMALLGVLLVIPAMAQSSGVTGRWKTIDDVSGQPKSIVEIFADGSEIKGKIVELINPSEPNPLCKECSGDKKDKPIQGLEIIWGLNENGGEWTGGHILDPKNGKTYKCKMRLEDGGKKLVVRGFIGFSLLGRSQTWIKE